MILMLATAPLAPALQAVGWALLHLVWQGAAIAAALGVLLALLPARSANARYVLSCAALALVVVAGALTGWREYRASLPHAVPARAFHAASATGHTVAPSVASMVITTFVPATIPTLPDPWRAAGDALPGALPMVVSLWLTGVTLLSLRLIVQWLRARRLVTRNAQPACEPWLAIARRLGGALGVRQAVRLLESTAVQVPAVVGHLRPVILLPANTLTGLMPGQLEMILAHELAHIRRHDFLVNLVQAAVETLLFYHPAVWWISNQVRIERENCCDDLAVSVCGNPLQYARALTRLEELRVEALTFALSARGGSLLHRIRRVVSGPTASGGPVRGVTALALLIGLALVFAAPSLTAIAKPGPAAQAGTRNATRTAIHFETAEHTVTRTHTVVETSACPSVEEKCPDTMDEAESTDAGDVADVADVADAADASEAADAAAATAADAASDAAGEAVASAADDDPEPTYEPNSTEAIAHGRIRLTVDELIALRSQGVTTADILEMRSLFPNIDIRDIAGMYAVGATPEYIRRMNATGLRTRTPEEAKSMAAVGVTPEFLAEMRAAGLEVKSAKVACGLAAVGVTADYIRGMRAAGFAITSADEAKGLVATGVTPEYVQGMRSVGLKVASAREVQGLAAVGVTPDFVREMRAAGVPIQDAKEAQSLVAVGVTPKFVRRLARAGYANLSVSELCRLGAGGVTEGFVEEMAQYRTR